MNLSSKELAIKYHSFEDDTWVKNGSNFIALISGQFEFNSQKFKSKSELNDYIVNSDIFDVLIVCDNEVEPNLIAEVINSCKSAKMSRIAIKNTFAYG